MPKRETIVYFADWKEGSSPRDLPWESISCINHAFYAVRPADGSEETSFERREAGLPARTEFEIVPLTPEREAEHFAAYAEMSSLHPDTKIMISVGGWTRCGYFSEMAYTAAGRKSFARSCVELIRCSPWISGIDIDWEYPAGTVHGERRPDGNDGDEGCPIFGTAEEDSRNFALMLEELKAYLDEAFGKNKKLLTACSSGSTETTLPCCDWKAASEYLDLINIMTYDLCGVWDGYTGHSSSASDSLKAAQWFTLQGIRADKLCLGSPLYGSVFVMKEPAGNSPGVPCETVRPRGELIQEKLAEFENTPGWHSFYDEKKDAAWMYNDDEYSPYFRWYVSYENKFSLQKKLEIIKRCGFAGIIVWESTQDTADYRMIRKMYEELK